MKVTNNELMELLKELQSLHSLQSFALAGGTNLSIRFNHRESLDIDLFSNQMIGMDGLSKIENQIRDAFTGKLLYLNIEDPGYGEQYCFIKSLIRTGESSESAFKVEILQNIQILHKVEVVNNVRLISVGDIGMMKLQSLLSRTSRKDLYDLDRITDEIPLSVLMEQLRNKEDKFREERYKSLFDLDEKSSPLHQPEKLLVFDEINYKGLDKRPSHGNDILKINVGNKNWFLARRHWKRKVLQYCKENNLSLTSRRMGIHKGRGIR